MAADETTPDPPLFKNVPRRPRSVPRKEEPNNGGDPSGDSISNNASPPATSVASSNKRWLSSTGGGAEHVPRAKRKLAPIKEPEPEPEDAKDRGVVGALDRHGILLGGRMPPAFSHEGKAAAAAAAASPTASSSSDSEPDVDWAENERWRKEKTPVVNDEDDAVARRRRRPAGSGLGNKLMGDAIRSHRGSTAAEAGGFEPSSRTTKAKKPAANRKPRAKPKKEKATKKKDSSAWFWCGIGSGTSSAGSDADYSFDRIGVVSDRLRTTLRGLGVAAGAPGPVRVYGKLLSASDRGTHQARLLMSCKRWIADRAEFPVCAFLTEEERRKAHGDGLALTAYDRGGDAYELTYRYLKSNGGGRLISKWSDFLNHNGLVVGDSEGGEPPTLAVGDDVMLDLWMFRSPPGGQVRMVVLHYRSGDAAHADAALEELAQKRERKEEQERLEEAEQMRRQLMLNNGDAAGAGGNNGNDEDDAIMEDVVGDANEDAGVNGGEVAAAAAPASSSPSSSEPSGGGAPGEVAATSSSPSSEEDDGVGAKASAKEQAGALGEVADDAPSTSSELHGGAGRSGDEVTAPLSLGGDGREEEQQAGGALMVMVLEVEAVTQSSLDSSAAGGETNEVAAPPSSPEAGGGAAAMIATEHAAAAAELEAAARSWNVTTYEYQAALGLVMLSKANSNSNS